ncbi:MAG TPA: hypothetical protein VGE97_02500 [Nitrososphaera sp.]
MFGGKGIKSTSDGDGVTTEEARASSVDQEAIEKIPQQCPQKSHMR